MGKIIESRRRPLRTRMLARTLSMLSRGLITINSSLTNKNDYASTLTLTG